LQIPKSVYVTLGGGLGDVYYVYMKGENGWGYIESLKKLYPNIKVKVLCSTHNPQTVEFIKNNPYIDEIKEYGWVLNGSEIWNKHNNGAVSLKNNRILRNTLKFNTPSIYLDNGDNVLVDSIVDQGKFIIIHPFAGEPHRIAMPPKEYIPLIDILIDNLGFNVVLVGGTYTRTNRVLKEHKPEKLVYERKGLINLIDKANARVVATLTKHQYHFIGCWSAYSCVSWLHKKPTTVIVQEKDKPKLLKKQTHGKRWYKAKCKILTTTGPSVRPGDMDFDKLRIKIINSIKI